MKLRMFALAGVALAALTTSASAAPGWYVGISAGWSHEDPVRLAHATPPLSITGKTDGAGIFAGTFGYQFDGYVRLESELAYSSHDVSASTGATGSVATTTELIDVIADIPLYSDWKLSVGAGIGAGSVKANVVAAPFTVAAGQKTGFAWQALTGVTVPLSPQVDAFADYHYRNVELNQGYTSSFTSYNPIIVKGTHELNVMFGLRWHFG